MPEITTVPNYPPEVANAAMQSILKGLAALGQQFGPNIVLDILINAVGAVVVDFDIKEDEMIDGFKKAVKAHKEWTPVEKEVM